MSRKNRSSQVPQRSRLVANRELRMALKSPRPQPFGIRRPLDYESQQPLLGIFTDLMHDGEIPDTILRRNPLHVTLMPKRRLDRQLSRGLVIGYEFGRASAAIENNLKEAYPKQIEAQLGRAAIIKNRYVGLRVESGALQEEHQAVLETMGRLGLKGALREPESLHISLGDITLPLSRFEKRHVIEALNTTMPVGEPITLDPIDFYPSPLARD